MFLIMKREFIFIVFLFWIATAQAQQNAPANNSQQREVKWVNPEIKEMEGLKHCILNSSAMGHEVGYVIWTPADYAQHANKRYPVVFFLHGMGGNETSDAAAFSEYVATAIRDGFLPPVICVFPNGGLSGYRDAVERMIINELIPIVDREYRTLAQAQSRVLTGFSMGGAGSMNLAIMHPELFCAVGSMGGRFRITEQLTSAIEKAIPVWKKNNFGFFFVNGDNDRPETFNEFSALMNQNGIENQLMILPDTGHDLGKYYRESSADLFKLIKARLKTE